MLSSVSAVSAMASDFFEARSMRAFHSFWSEPNRSRHNGSIVFPDFEQLTAILSALEWRYHSGPVCMITDSDGAEYFRRAGLSVFWDSTETALDDLSGKTDPFLFWAAGKLYSLKTMKAPCVMLDTDIIIWKDIRDMLSADVVAAHPEQLNENVYPDRAVFRLKNGYEFPSEWDFSLDAANTAFLYIRNQDFLEHYVDRAAEFFANVEAEGLNPVTAMCFAEQRVLPMCAAAKKQSIGFLFDICDADIQDIATHTWGFKQVLEELPESRYQFCMRCVRRIAVDFPEFADRLKQCPDLAAYYEDYCREPKENGLRIVLPGAERQQNS